ncbi:MAG: sulfotransferase family 2 domain-containing protein, partial [Flavobacteriales bacterium]
MKDNLIFVHIPKTGGTTLYAALNNTFWNADPNFNYRHIIEKTKISNAGDIFDMNSNDKYLEYKILMMLRHPVDKIISEYYFFKEMQTILNFVKNKPKNLTEYVLEKQTSNATINFLKGRRLYDTKFATRKDLEDVIESIEKLNIQVGLFEEFPLSLKLYTEKLGINWNKNIDIKRTTFQRPKTNELSDSIKELIIENNNLDFELYNYYLNKFKKETANYKKVDINLIRNRYNDVLPYAFNACLFGFCLENKKFLSQNFEFFKLLTFHLLKTKQIKDGKLFTNIWNQTFLNAVSIHFPDSDFYQKIKLEGEFNLDDPLE